MVLKERILWNRIEQNKKFHAKKYEMNFEWWRCEWSFFFSFRCVLIYFILLPAWTTETTTTRMQTKATTRLRRISQFPNMNFGKGRTNLGMISNCWRWARCVREEKLVRSMCDLERQYISLLDVTFARSENVLILKTKLITHLGGNNSKLVFYSCVSCLTVCDFVVTQFFLNDLSLSQAICVRVALVVVKNLASVCICLCGCCSSEWAPEREKTVNFA